MYREKGSKPGGFMRKHTFLALILAGVSMLTMSAVAQNDNNDQPSAPMGEHHGGHHMDPAKRTEMLTKHLKLTSDQQAKVLDIFKSEQSQMEGLRSDSSLSQDDRHSKMMEIHKTTYGQVRALLNPDQQKKYDTMQSQHEHREGGGPGATPSGESQ
jgi:periplasmic protein CpxP/Spy